MLSVRTLDSIESEKACRRITESLPEWFGIPEANERYALGVSQRLCFGHFAEEVCLGMICLEFPFAKTANIYWMGVKKSAHGLGIGQSLIQYTELYCLEKQIETLTVETLSLQVNDPCYELTYKFYLKHGFRPLFELPTYGPEFQMVYLAKFLSPNIFQWVDLAHPLSENIPTWEGSCGFRCHDIENDEGEGCRFLVQKFEMFAGAGTHVDAPSHCFPNHLCTADLPQASMLNPCVVLDVSEKASEKYRIDLNDLRNFENLYGTIPKGAFVIFYTGWDKFWHDPKQYRNDLCFPSVAKELAETLVRDRKISGLGIDTLSPDLPDSGFPVHQIVLGADKIIIENIANANQMPPTGGYLLAPRIKVIGGAEAQVPLLGIISRS